MPPHAAASIGTAASASAAKKRDLMSRSYFSLPRGLGDQGTGGLRIADFGLRIDCGLRIADCGSWTAGVWLPTELLEAGDHQAVRLGRERLGQERVPLGVARELLGERDEV